MPTTRLASNQPSTMLVPVVHLVLALCATVHVARAAVEASNSSMGTDPFNYAGHLWLRDADGTNITELIPLSVQATTTNVSTVCSCTAAGTLTNDAIARRHPLPHHRPDRGQHQRQ